MRVGVILPTVRDTRGKWLEWFVKRTIPSLRFLNGLPVKLLINFQNYQQNDVLDLLRLIRKYLPVEIDHSCINYSPPVSMAEIRETIANMDTSCDLYLCIDDDIVFGPKSTQKYLAVVEYFQKTPRCGSLMCMGFRGGANFGDNVVETNTGMWWTNRGLFLRKIGSDWSFCPHDVVGLKGTLEETYAIYSRFQLGYHAAKVYNFDTKHKVSRVDNYADFVLHSNKKSRYDLETDLHNPKFDGILQVIRQKWNDPTWTYLKLDMPKYLHHEYVTNGGKDLSTKIIVPVMINNLPLSL